MTVPAPTFLTELPLRQARRLADRELHNQTTPAELAWLHARPLLWMRALVNIRRDVESHIAKSRLDLVPLKPPAGTDPSPAYLAAKMANDKLNQGRIHFMRVVERRLEEVVSLLGHDPVTGLMTSGDLIRLMTEMVRLAEEDDVEAIKNIGTALVAKWTRRLKENAA